MNIKHADSWRLQQLFLARHSWLAPLTDSPRRFSHQIEGKRITVRIHN
jgi:RNA-directed DNA polymerase